MKKTIIMSLVFGTILMTLSLFASPSYAAASSSSSVPKITVYVVTQCQPHKVQYVKVSYDSTILKEKFNATGYTKFLVPQGELYKVTLVFSPTVHRKPYSVTFNSSQDASVFFYFVTAAVCPHE